MHLTRLIASAAVAATTIAAVRGGQAAAARVVGLGPNPIDASAIELRRVRLHFDSVLADLSLRDVSSLSPAQLKRRASAVATIRAYRDSGVFPHNYDFRGQYVPYFVDPKTGTLCAVAHLLASTGRRDIVDRVARANNNVWVNDLAADTAFSAWLSTNGLTLAEAAHIQVVYAYSPSPTELAANAAFIIAAPFAVTGSAFTIVSSLRGNADGHSGRRNVIGLVSGLATIAIGARLNSFDHSQLGGIGAATAAFGATSVALSTRGIYRHHAIASAAHDAAKQQPVVEPAVTSIVAPIVTTGAHPTAGLGVSLRF
jgi:hypothetical protein